MSIIVKEFHLEMESPILTNNHELLTFNEAKI